MRASRPSLAKLQTFFPESERSVHVDLLGFCLGFSFSFPVGPLAKGTTSRRPDPPVQPSVVMWRAFDLIQRTAWPSPMELWPQSLFSEVPRGLKCLPRAPERFDGATAPFLRSFLVARRSIHEGNSGEGSIWRASDSSEGLSGHMFLESHRQGDGQVFHCLPQPFRAVCQRAGPRFRDAVGTRCT